MVDGLSVYSPLDEKPVGWKTIDSAPNDTEVWAFNGEQVRMKTIDISASDEPRQWIWVYADDTLADIDPEPIEPSHWMPLPEPPSKGE